ncbi:MAG: 4Fe-4S dicluster domain-containing protein [Bacteroidales bacterium]|nr:4Fe-4S dicluster domain-containing protein [Bacteroidales bacterium]
METHLLESVSNTLGDTSLCYQCAKCSNGCPVGEEMDVLPHQVIHLASLGMEERVLDSRTIWICANCYACAVKCPNDINITSVMNDLKQQAIDWGMKPQIPEVYQFHQVFTRDVMRRGKAHELFIMGEYNLRLRKPFKNVLLAPKMFLKNKLKLFPPKAVKGFRGWVHKLMAKRRRKRKLNKLLS